MSMLDIKNNNEDKLEIKLKGELNQKDLYKIIFWSESLFSLPNIHKWNKNNKLDKNTIRFNIILLGEKVGKTSILTRFTENNFKEKRCSTIGIDIQKKLIRIRNFYVELQIFDTSSQERFNSITVNFLENIANDGILFILDITNKYSLSTADYWIKKVQNMKFKNNNNYVSMICANKCDLEKQRKISHDELIKFGKKYKMEIVETSAKNGKNINEVFKKLTWLILEN